MQNASDHLDKLPVLRMALHRRLPHLCTGACLCDSPGERVGVKPASQWMPTSEAKTQILRNHYSSWTSIISKPAQTHPP